MKSPSGEMPQYLMIKAQLQARIQNGALKKRRQAAFRARAVRAVQHDADYGA